jgi:hypothetical protein
MAEEPKIAEASSAEEEPKTKEASSAVEPPEGGAEEKGTAPAPEESKALVLVESKVIYMTFLTVHHMNIHV